MAVTATARGAPRAPARAVRVIYASFESRVVAATLDLLVLVIIAALFVTAGSISVLVSSDFERATPSSMSINIFWGSVGAIAPGVLLYVFIAYAWKGQTLGMAVMQLLVIRSDGRPLGVLGAAARVVGLLGYLLLFALGAIAAYAFRDDSAYAAGSVGIALFVIVLGVLWAAFDPRRRTLHDRVAGTIVVRLR